MHRHEVNWLFYGVRNDFRFTVVLVENAPHVWFTFLEGSNAEERPDPSIRAWALSIIETPLLSHDDTDNLR